MIFSHIAWTTLSTLKSPAITDDLQSMIEGVLDLVSLALEGIELAVRDAEQKKQLRNLRQWRSILVQEPKAGRVLAANDARV
jgi:hypothetical protein